MFYIQSIYRTGNQNFNFHCKGDKARLAINLDRTFTGQICTLRFWVHMYGDHIEKLRVLTRTHINGAETEVLSLTDQYNAWTLMDVPLSMNSAFQVRQL